MQSTWSIQKKQNPFFFLSTPKCQHLQMSYRSHFWKVKHSPWVISSVTQQTGTKNRWGSQLTPASARTTQQQKMHMLGLCQMPEHRQLHLILTTSLAQALLIPIFLKMGKLSLRQVKWLGQDHTDIKGRNQVTHLGLPIPVPELFIHPPWFPHTEYMALLPCFQEPIRPKSFKQLETRTWLYFVLVPKDGCQRKWYRNLGRKIPVNHGLVKELF